MFACRRRRSCSIRSCDVGREADEASEVAASAQMEATRQVEATSTTTATASTSETVPRKSWTRRLSVGGGGTKSQIEKLRAEMEDDITVRRGRVSLDETSSDGSTHRTYAKMDGLNAIECLGLKAPEDGSVDGDSNKDEDDENDEGADSASKGEEEPRDYRNQKMRSLEDRGKNDVGLVHGCVAFLCAAAAAGRTLRHGGL